MKRHGTFLFIAALAWTFWAAGCDSAFAPPNPSSPTDGDKDADASDPDPDVEPDGDQDGEIDEEILDYNLRLLPQFAYQGDTIRDGTIEFKNLEEVREKLNHGNPAFQSWQVDYGPDINFILLRFDSEALRFHSMEAVVSATARTGERLVRVRVTYGDVSVVEHGRFYVLPPPDSANLRRTLPAR
ncbi:MAG: hypothetical protein C4523_08470 [Myxococcales bacterium]|nr:MAG: hypothetical protein C4523_08470 [Myxococcales bacterium]